MARYGYYGSLRSEHTVNIFYTVVHGVIGYIHCTYTPMCKGRQCTGGRVKLYYTLQRLEA